MEPGINNYAHHTNRSNFAIKISTIITILIISIDVSPIPTTIFLAQSNTVIIIGISLVLFVCACILNVLTKPSKIIWLMLTFALSELILQIFKGTPFYVAPMIIITVIAFTLLKSCKMTTQQYGRVFRGFTDILVILYVLNILALHLFGEHILHDPLWFVDDSIHRKVDNYGNTYIQSLGIMHYLPFDGAIIDLTSSAHLMPTGTTSEPHFFSALVTVGFIFRLATYHYKTLNLIYIIIYILVILSTVSATNIIAISLTLTLYLYNVCRLHKYRYILILLISVILVYFSGSFIRFLLTVADGTFSANPTNLVASSFADRSGLQTVLSILRVFEPSVELGTVTYGPELANDYIVDKIFITNLFLFWAITISLFILPAVRSISPVNRHHATLYCLIYYLGIYSLKNITSIPFIPFILLTFLMLHRQLNEPYKNVRIS